MPRNPRPQSPAAIGAAGDGVVSQADYLSRDEVLARLGIKQQTLYAYVSRGFIRSVARPDGRSSYYLREDVERLRARRLGRAGQGAAAATAIRWGDPIMETAITRIGPEGPWYRGHAATALARSGLPFENVAELLWTGTLPAAPLAWPTHPGGPDLTGPDLTGIAAALRRLRRDAHVVQLMAASVLALGVAAGLRRQRFLAGQTPLALAREMVRALAGTLGFLGPAPGWKPPAPGEGIAAAVAGLLIPRAASPAGPGAVAAINTALIMAADHELNPATFAARVAASGSCDLHSSVGAALNTHYGTLVGRACDRVEKLFDPRADAETLFARARQMLGKAETLPGFDHPLYPAGDPRARHLIAAALAAGGAVPSVRAMHAVALRLEGECRARPKIEFGLVLLCRALDLPPRSASGLYALGQVAGWVAHVLEQRSAGFVIRPRARFGPPPLTPP